MRKKLKFSFSEFRKNRFDSFTKSIQSLNRLDRFINGSTLGSENRDRGGIQWYSEPTSTPGPLLKININYEG